MEKNSQVMVNGVRSHIYDVLQNQDSGFYARMRTGDLMTRMTNDLDLIRHCQSWICYNVIDCITLFTVALVFLCTVNLEFALCLAAVTPFVLILTRMFSKIIKPKFAQLRNKLSQLNTVAQENIAGNRVVKAFARENYEMQRFEEKNTDYSDINMEIARTRVKIQPFISLLSQLLTVITLVVGGLFMINGKITAGEMMAFSSLTWALSAPLQNLGMIINDIQRFFTSASMVMELFYSKSGVNDEKGATTPDERMNGAIKFENVVLKRNGKVLIDNLSLNVPAGSSLGIMGATGSGKTVLVSLLNRTMDISSGAILLDDIPVKKLSLSFLRQNISIAIQDMFCFRTQWTEI